MGQERGWSSRTPGLATRCVRTSSSSMDWVFREPPPIETPLRAAIRDWHRLGETEADARIAAAAELPPEARDRIGITARRLVAAVRQQRIGGGLDAFLHEYALSSQEGVALMCLAEALVRIPDAETVDKLIRDKIAAADWEWHLGHSDRCSST